MQQHDDRQRVLDATDLVAVVGEHISLKRKGREHVGICPFHDDSSPSLHVVTHKGNAFYKCFACGASGNAIDFMMNYHRLDFPGALKALADRAGFELTTRDSARRSDSNGIGRSDLLEANSCACKFYQSQLARCDHSNPINGMLLERGIDEQMQQRFGLGLSPDAWNQFHDTIERARRESSRSTPLPSDQVFVAAGLLKPRRDGSGMIDAFRNRIMFPIMDEMGRTIAFGARQIDAEDSPKYLNSPESDLFHKSRSLYGIHQARQAIIDQGHAIVTEGYTDVIACHRGGFSNTVATLGTALTADHVRLLRRLTDNVVLLFDGDAAGAKAADRAMELFMGESITLRIATLPEGMDPDDLLKSPDGTDRLRQAIDTAPDALEFMLARFRSSLSETESVWDRQKVLMHMLEHLGTLGFASMDGIRKQFVVAALSDLTGIPVDRILSSIPTARQARPRPAADQGHSTDAPINPLPGTGASPARREAEQRVLGILLCNSELLEESLELDADSFSVPEHRTIFTCLAESGSSAKIQEIMSMIPDKATSALVGDLYYRTSDFCPEATSEIIQLLQDSARDLASTIRLEDDRTARQADAFQTPEQVQRRLQELRERGPDMTTIARARIGSDSQTDSIPSQPRSSMK